MSAAQTDDADVFAPLQLEVLYTEVAAQHYVDRLQAIIRTRGMKAGEAYAMGTLIASVSAARAAFDDFIVQRVLDVQMALEMPHEAPADKRKH